MANKEKSSGMVIYQSRSFWIEVDQRVLEFKKLGIKTNRTDEAAKLMQIGLAQVNNEYKNSEEFANSILGRDEYDS